MIVGIMVWLSLVWFCLFLVYFFLLRGLRVSGVCLIWWFVVDICFGLLYGCCRLLSC